jgi:hypothetical protein
MHYAWERSELHKDTCRKTCGNERPESTDDNVKMVEMCGLDLSDPGLGSLAGCRGRVVNRGVPWNMGNEYCIKQSYRFSRGKPLHEISELSVFIITKFLVIIYCVVLLFSAINNKLVAFLVSFLELSVSYRYQWTGCLLVDKNKCKCCLEDLRIVSAEMLPAIHFARPLMCLVHQSVSLSYTVLVHQSVVLICRLSLIRLVHQSLVVFLIFIHWPVSFTSLYITVIANVQLLYSTFPVHSLFTC